MAKCTGLGASWCPNHGDCTCPRKDDGEPIDWYDESRSAMNRPDCPLHGETSDHVTPPAITVSAEADHG